MAKGENGRRKRDEVRKRRGKAEKGDSKVGDEL